MIELESVEEIRINRQGYDKSGNYWGIGQRLFVGYFLHDGEYYTCVNQRCKDKRSAKRYFQRKLDQFITSLNH